MKNLKKIILVFALLVMSSCSEVGWIGYYSIKKPDGSSNKISYNTDNGSIFEFPKNKELWLELPRDCSGFKLSGIITPITPPIPLFWFRSWSMQDCHYFTVKTKPDTKVQVKVGERIFTPENDKDLYGYSQYKFPIRAKEIDSGILVIEKNGERIEVPFGYKYFRFWY